MDFTQEPHFPTEIWELIFGNCSPPDLRRFRLVCHRWNDIVMGCPSLWHQFIVRICSEHTENLQPAMLPPVKRAYFQLNVGSVSSWWPRLGQHLEELVFPLGSISTTTLFGVLKHCPNLKRLWFDQGSILGGEVDNDFSLDFMEELTIYFHLNGIDLAFLMKPIFPYLKKLSLWKGTFAIDSWINFIIAVQGTLQSLLLPRGWFLVRQLCQMDRLKLRHARLGVDCSLNSWDMELWIKFCRMQNSLEDLTIVGPNITREILSATVQNLPQLRNLESDLSCSHQTELIFLYGPNILQSVAIKASSVNLRFSSRLSSTLTELKLFNTIICDGVEYLITSSNIQKLTLSGCNLSTCRVPIRSISVLRHLQLNDCQTTPQMLDYILSCHPRLESAVFCFVQFIDKSSIEKLLCASPNLQRNQLIVWPSLEETSVNVRFSNALAVGSR